MIRPILKNTPYDIYKERNPNTSHLYIFRCKCFVLNNNKDNLGKFDENSDKGIFLSYVLSSKAFRIFNKRTLLVEASVHVSFHETNPSKEDKIVDVNDDDLDEVPNEVNINDAHVEQII